MINVSEILPLRPIKVNNGKFYLLLRSGYFANGCVFTRVYVICKICEKLRRRHSCRYSLVLSQPVLWHTGQERMGPSKERSAGQRTFLSLTLTGDVLFGVRFENNCDGCCKCASFLRLLGLWVCLVLLPDSTTRHVRVVIYYYRSVNLQWSIASLVTRLFYFWDEDTIEQQVSGQWVSGAIQWRSQIQWPHWLCLPGQLFQLVQLPFCYAILFRMGSRSKCILGSLRYGDYGLRATAGRALSFVCSTGLSRANIER